MGSIGLPDKNSPDLHLVVATDEEWRDMQVANSDEWRGALSLEAYLRREEVLANQDLTRHHGLTPWVLVHQPEMDGPRHVLCGCESIKKQAVRCQDGQITKVICHGVCSVFCPPHNRGHGYAGRMMSELGPRLKHWQADKATPVLFSVLYSDIGKDFYAARGWHAFPSAHINLPPSSASPPPDVKPLQKEDLPQLCALDQDILHSQLSKVKQGTRSAIAITPDLRTLAWHHAREDFVSQELYGKSPEVKGVIVGDTPGSRAWAYFTRVWTNPQEEAPPTLHILRLVIENESDSDFAAAASPEGVAKLNGTGAARAIASILAAAQVEAARWDMKEVSIWNPTSATVAAAQSIDPHAVIVHREKESIASLQWYGDGSSWREVNWVCNEKYGWC